MAAGVDVRDILEMENASQEIMTKDALFNDTKKKLKPKKTDLSFKRPEGMHRELWGLLWTDSKDAPPIIPTDTNLGYKQMKAKIGQSRVRPWKWMPFTNPARKDGAVFHHWRRVADEGKDYPFARFNKSVDIAVYSDLEYQQHLHEEGWSRQETDHLFELCRRFDLRFTVIHDRYDKSQFSDRSIEDLKERYYNICNILTKVRAPQGTDAKVRVFDADHERRRKDQLNKLFNRTNEQIEEEEYLLSEQKKIEQRKKEREKKTQDLQKLITAADSNMEARRSERKTSKKKVSLLHHKHDKLPEKHLTAETTSIKFADFKQSGVSLRSQRMKLPASVGQKKTKAIEQVLEELGLELNPMPTDDIVQSFNELRQSIVLLYELKLALANCEYELQTLRHQFETLAPGKMPDLGAAASLLETASPSCSLKSTPSARPLVEAIDVVGSLTPPPQPATPSPSPAAQPPPQPSSATTPILQQKKRKAALEQSNVLKKLRKS